MANKSKRRSTPSKAAPAQVASVSAPKTASTRAFSQEFKPDYTPVKEDLKRIAYLAGIFLIILIVLSFVLR